MAYMAASVGMMDYRLGIATLMNAEVLYAFSQIQYEKLFHMTYDE